MATLKYVGKTTPFMGKTLWEIIGNLKDFGVGRIVVRHTQVERYKEPCFMRILEVNAQPNVVPPKIKVFRPPNDLRDKDRPRQVHVLCETVFRGVKLDEPQLIQYDSVFADYQLVPKHLEKNYTFTKTSAQQIEENIIPRYMDFPPLLKDILIKSGAKDLKLKTVQNESARSLYRTAKEDEQPTKQFENGYGISKSPHLLNGINYDI